MKMKITWFNASNVLRVLVSAQKISTLAVIIIRHIVIMGYQLHISFFQLLLLLVFSLIFTVVSRLLLLYSTVDKISRLKMKSFSTMSVTQRGSQHYMEKRRGRRELEVT